MFFHLFRNLFKRHGELFSSQIQDLTFEAMRALAESSESNERLLENYLKLRFCPEKIGFWPPKREGPSSNCPCLRANC